MIFSFLPFPSFLYTLPEKEVVLPSPEEGNSAAEQSEKAPQWPFPTGRTETKGLGLRLGAGKAGRQWQRFRGGTNPVHTEGGGKRWSQLQGRVGTQHIPKSCKKGPECMPGWEYSLLATEKPWTPTRLYAREHHLGRSSWHPQHNGSNRWESRGRKSREEVD